ncbi:glucosaminidase domain-containing protein [Enterococcus sp.]|uniref:glucosaminidase domain-containing protein n=1 Tax=Enterococcus sp. TaxID=35783 RepID=UPI0028AA3C9F|nr:glucosaminidase domain-containing protein [Enterococcus sp.]
MKRNILFIFLGLLSVSATVVLADTDSSLEKTVNSETNTSNNIETLGEVEKTDITETAESSKDSTAPIVSENTITSVEESTIASSESGSSETKQTQDEQGTEISSSSEIDLSRSARSIEDTDITFSGHVQRKGWQNAVKGNMNGFSYDQIGSIEEGLRLEAVNIDSSSDTFAMDIQYKIQGDQEWLAAEEAADGSIQVGSVGLSKKLHAVKINLANQGDYDVYYQVHVQSYGWLDWAKNGEETGFVDGLSKRIEAIRIAVIEKGQAAPSTAGTRKIIQLAQPSITYQSHIQRIGWQNPVSIGTMTGTSGQSLRMEAFRLNKSSGNVAGNIQYRGHVQSIGWQPFVNAGTMTGTNGRSLRLEAIQFRLTGEMADTYDLYYRVHVQRKGWTDWSKNDERSGSVNLGLRAEAIEVRLQLKGTTSPSTFKRPTLFGQVQASSTLGTTEAQAAFINTNLTAAMRTARTHNLYASVLLAQAILESNYGTSALAQNAQNYFGLKWRQQEGYPSYSHQTSEYDEEKGWITIIDDFAKFTNFSTSAEGYAKRIRNGLSWDPLRYQMVWRENTTSYRDATLALSVTYATDPNYKTKLNTIIENWQLTQFD